MSIQFNSVQQNYNAKQEVSFGRRKIPRYLYHLTTADTWEKIQSSGKLIPSLDPDVGKGVFMMDLINFFTRWREFGVKNFFWGNNLHEILLHATKKDNSNLVILRIKSDSLSNRSKFFVRDEATLVRKNGVKTKEYGHSHSNEIPNAGEARQLRRKTAIEYIYKDKEGIPITNVEKIGETILKRDEFGKLEAPELPKIWKNLLAGTPESKAIVQLEKRKNLNRPRL